MRLARRLIDAFEDADVDTIVSNVAGCGSTLKNTPGCSATIQSTRTERPHSPQRSATSPSCSQSSLPRHLVTPSKPGWPTTTPATLDTRGVRAQPPRGA